MASHEQTVPEEEQQHPLRTRTRMIRKDQRPPSTQELIQKADSFNEQ